MSTSPDDLMTTVEVCEALNVDRSTLTRWVSTGRIEAATKLPGLRGAYLYSPAEVAHRG